MKVRADLYRNVGSSILPQFMNIVTYLILPTMIISGYGSQTNGLISTVRNIISYISLVGAGIALATTQALYAPVANKNIDEVKGMLKATANLFNRCGVVYVLIVLLVACLYPFLIKSDISYSTMSLLLVVMSISGASEFFVVGRCRSLLYANQKVYVCTIIQAISLFVSLVLAVIMLKMHVNIVLVQLAISFVYVSRAIMLYFYVAKSYPEYRFDKSTKPILKAVEKRKYAMIHQLSGLLVMSSQTIILTLLVNLEAASIYAVYNIVFSGLVSICGNIQSAITPYLGKAYAVDEKGNVQRKFNLLEVAFYALTFVMFFTTSKTILSFVAIYTKNADINYLYEDFALLFVAVQIFNVFRLPSSAMINVAGHFKETRSRALTEAGICVITSIVFTYFFGMYGVLMGFGCAIGWRCLDMVVYARNRILNTSFYKSVFRLLRIFAYVFGLYYFLPNTLISIDGYATWTLNALACFGMALIILFFDLVVFERSALIALKR